MQILEAVESISRQRSIETVELALLQTLGDNFSEITEAELLTYELDQWWISISWAEGRLQNSKALQPASDIHKRLADAAMANTEAHDQDLQAFKLEHQEPAQVLILRAINLDEAGQRALASVIKIVENFSQLLREKNCDRLTGLLNRHQLEESILHALSVAQESEQHNAQRRHARHPDWLAILDIDHFKQVNDIFGHLFGDEVLLRVSQLMVDCFRREDKLFRYGGEEFVLILMDLPQQEAEIVLERFRERMATNIFPQLGHITLSIGFTRIAAQGSDSAVLGEADRALYWAKQHGRNRCINYAALVEQGQLDAHATNGSIDLF
ncbi:MAG: GGDEF domain-containing protein [Pseudomonas sp.]